MNSRTSRNVRIETVAAARASQVIWPEWMATACAGLADHELVEIEREHLAFGSYVIAIRPASNRA